MDGTSEEQYRLVEGAVPCRIKKGLFLGCYDAAKNKAALKSENVTHILTVANLSPPAFPNEFVYKIIDVRDKRGTNIAHFFEECFHFIEEAIKKGGGVLVHCAAGISRSVTIVVAYLMKEYSMSFPKALEYVREKRPMACPNSGFMKLLQNFEKSLQVDEDRGDTQSKESNDCFEGDSTTAQISCGFNGFDTMQMEPIEHAIGTEKIPNCVDVSRDISPTIVHNDNFSFRKRRRKQKAPTRARPP